MLRGVTIWRHNAIFQLFTPTELWKLQNRLLCWKLILQWIRGEKTKKMFDTLFRLFPHSLNVITNLWCYKTPNIHRIDLTSISNAHNSHTFCHYVSNILTEFSLIIFLGTLSVYVSWVAPNSTLKGLYYTIEDSIAVYLNDDINCFTFYVPSYIRTCVLHFLLRLIGAQNVDK